MNQPTRDPVSKPPRTSTPLTGDDGVLARLALVVLLLLLVMLAVAILQVAVQRKRAAGAVANRTYQAALEFLHRSSLPRTPVGLVCIPTGSAWADFTLTVVPAVLTDGMVWVPAGEFDMGDPDPMFSDAQPVHTVVVDGFWMDRTEVTNAQFARFVRATGYATAAERQPSPRDYPRAPKERLLPGSLVFSPPPGQVYLDEPLSWWKYQPGADWRHPEGPQSNLQGRDQHPVVHVSWEDAAAYARWAGKRLPSEAEWERAARGGLEGTRYVWGDELRPEGKWMANLWQGRFPKENMREDGFAGAAPVASFPPNGYGLYDMAGNVWEWCADWYRPDYYYHSPTLNPQGPPNGRDPNARGIATRVQRGGSFLCSDLYCVRYRPGTRGKGDVKFGAAHVGFRCVR